MYFELLQLYRNYRNIDAMNSADGNFVFGHFEHLNFQNAITAEQALDLLYNQYIKSANDVKIETDVQPVILFSYDKHTIHINTEKCMVVSFIQIERPLDCNTIKEFYDYSVDVINHTIKRAKDEKLINDIEADVYIPLNFMDVAVVFYAENFLDVCTIIKNIIHNKLAKFQYSVLSLTDTFNFDSSKEFDISLRFIWKDSCEAQSSINLLKTTLNNLNITEYSLNHLMGNNDCLLFVPKKGNDILSQYMNPNSEFSKFMKCVQNTRASISFSCDDINNLNLNYDVKTNRVLSFDNREIEERERQFFENLKHTKAELSEFEQNEINDIIYKAIEFSKFIDVIRKHALKGIATPLYLSIEKSYKMFLEIATEKVSEINKYWTKDDVLQIIGSHLNDIMTYYNNIFHCNLGFFEERGFYNNIIGLASDVELAYNRYANLVCEVLMCDDEKNNQKLKICCAVTSDNEPTICTNDVFAAVKNPIIDKRSLININIPISYVFKNNVVSRIIIHEIAHYAGCRDREKRAEVLSKVISEMISDAIYQTVSIPFGIKGMPDNAIEICNEYEETEIYKKIHKQMHDDIKNIINAWFVNNVIKKCNGSFYMNAVIDSVVDVLNSITSERELLRKLTDTLVDFQFWYYEYFEDFYLTNYSKEENVTDIMNQLSDCSIKEYNRHFVETALNTIIDNLLNPPEDDKKLQLEEKSCNIYIADVAEFIGNLCASVSEAYCDLMMITLANMTFESYYDLMKGYGKDVERILSGNDYITWLRVNFVAKYMSVDFFDKIELSQNFKYFYDINVIKNMSEYFESLRPELSKVLIRCQNNPVLSDYMLKISSNDVEKCLEAMYGMFFNILSE